MKANFYYSVAGARQYLQYTQLHTFILLFLFIIVQAQAQQKEWDIAYGGSSNDLLSHVEQTRDGGYILGGYSFSGVSGDKTEPNMGNCIPDCTSDYWVVKIDANGNKEWDKAFGGNGTDELRQIRQTRDGGYILGGISQSGISNFFLIIKLSATGEKEWEEAISVGLFSDLWAVQQTTDGGYILGGFVLSDASSYDFRIIKLSPNGKVEWSKIYGGNDIDRLFALEQTNDGGYILGGDSNSGISGDKTEASGEGTGFDIWVIKLDASGEKQWDRTFGGENEDRLFSLKQTTDGGYILGGFYGVGSSEDEIDYWAIKLNPNGVKEWDTVIGGDSFDFLWSVDQANDGGYILGGRSNSSISGDKTETWGGTDFWVVKLDAAGNKIWDKAFGGDGGDVLTELQKTRDGGYILGGYSNSGISGNKTVASKGGTDYWIVKLGPEEGNDCTPPTPTITVVPTSNVFTGGDASTIYLGYGPQSVQLVATGADSYEWSPATGLSSANVAAPVFTPAAAGNFTFTVTGFRGTCSAAATVTITVVDARCDKDKVLVCHNGVQLCVAASAVEAHLRHHAGDKPGSCDTDASVKGDEAVNLSLKVFPNPFSSYSTAEFALSRAGSYRLELYNSGGRMLGIVAEGHAQAGQLISQQLQGDKLGEGVYYLKLISSWDVQTARLILKK